MAVCTWGLLLLLLIPVFGYRITLSPEATEILFTEPIDSDNSLTVIRFLYGLIEPPENVFISCTLKSPSGQIVHVSRDNSGYIQHRPREFGSYEFQVRNEARESLKFFFELSVTSYGNRLFPGFSVADASVVAQKPNLTRPDMHTLDTYGKTHFAYVRFDLSSIAKRDLEEAKLMSFGKIKATVQFWVDWTDAPGGSAICRLRHFYYEPKDAPNPPTEELINTTTVNKDLRSWEWQENELNFLTRPSNGHILAGLPCKAGSVVEFDVSNLILSALDSDKRQLTFELRSDNFWVKYVSRDAVHRYQQPFLIIEHVPITVLDTVIDLSQNLFAFRAEQSYFKAREREHRNTVESINFLALWLDVFGWIVLLAVSLIQFRVIKGLFHSK